MPSRKRNQGKVRKAKQRSQPPKEEIIVSDDVEKCEHELTIPCSLDQLKCHEFAQRFLKVVRSFLSDEDSTLDAYNSAWLSAWYMSKILRENRHIFDSDSYRKMAIKMLLKKGVDKIYRYTDKHLSLLNTDNSFTGSIAAGILVLENMKTLNDDEEEEKGFVTTKKVYKFLRSSNRSIIRFYMSRIKCSCLDERYAKVQSLPKISVCVKCSKPSETSKLFLCEGCKLAQYCSIKCQTAAWKTEHHEICGRRKSSKALEDESAPASKSLT